MRTTARRVVSSALALTLLSTAGLSQVMGPRRAARIVVPAPLNAEDQRFEDQRLREAAGRHEPIELSVREDVRERCGDFALPPEPYALESPMGTETDALALEGLVACLTRAPLDSQEIELIGPTELPGSREHAAEAAAAADAVRVVLNRSGIGFDRMVTRDVPFDPYVSSHAAPRVVIGFSAPGQD